MRASRLCFAPVCGRNGWLHFSVEAELMNQDGVRVTQIDWRKVIPSLRLLDAISLAVSPRVFLPVCVLLLGNLASDWLLADRLAGLGRSDRLRPLISLSDTELPKTFNTINQSLTALAAGNTSQSFSGILLLAWWMLLVGYFGVAAMRSAGCVFCTGAGSGIVASAKHAVRMWKAILLSTLLSWILLAMPCLAFRFLNWVGARTHDGITAFGAMLYVLCCVVLGIGWLLSLAAIAVDRCDGAEALSRGICYVLSRWLRVFVYALILSVILIACDLAVSWLTDSAHSLASSAADSQEEEKAFRATVWSTLTFFSEIIRLSVFLSGIVVAYVLLRNIEDGVNLREIDGGAKAVVL